MLATCNKNLAVAAMSFKAPFSYRKQRPVLGKIIYTFMQCGAILKSLGVFNRYKFNWSAMWANSQLPAWENVMVSSILGLCSEWGCKMRTYHKYIFVSVSLCCFIWWPDLLAHFNKCGASLFTGSAPTDLNIHGWSSLRLKGLSRPPWYYWEALIVSRKTHSVNQAFQYLPTLQQAFRIHLEGTSRLPAQHPRQPGFHYLRYLASARWGCPGTDPHG